MPVLEAFGRPSVFMGPRRGLTETHSGPLQFEAVWPETDGMDSDYIVGWGCATWSHDMPNYIAHRLVYQAVKSVSDASPIIYVLLGVCLRPPAELFSHT